MFYLRIHQEEQLCFFDLSWGEDQRQRLSRSLKFPNALMQRYRDWQHAYLSFYRQVRGQAAASGAISAPEVDWHARLVEAETHLLIDFHRWLQQPELFEFYTTIAQASRTLPPETEFLEIFLTCAPLELARLPWESWELGASVATNLKIRMARVPLNIRNPAAAIVKRRSRPRILVILGSDRTLDFSADWQQLERSIKHLADIPKPIGWREGKSIDQLQAEIVQALVDPQGWDVLFFAGHSNENPMLGGEIGIAPGASIRIREIKTQLEIACQNGLQFALLNSCSGLNIADSLINLGLNQVAVMREPIHNRVAQEFLVQFMQGLAQHHDVHESLLSACQFLKTEKNLTYPSAYLIPSLFRYPNIKLYQIPVVARWHWPKQFAPKRYEAIALLALMLLSWPLPIQRWLLERRVLTQAIYWQTTQQISNQPPPVLLVQVDDRFFDQKRIVDRNPIPYDALADLIEKVAAHRPKLIGIDYILDLPQDQAQIDRLGAAVRSAQAQGTQFVFGADYEQNSWHKAFPEILNNSLSGDIAVRRNHMDLPIPGDELQPLSYVLAQNYQKNWQTNRTERSPITTFSYGLGQWWLDPIVDYSLPPNQAYTTVSAGQLLAQTNLPELENIAAQVVIIAPGGYAEAGITPGSDNFQATPAVQHWFKQADPRGREMTGAEFHAYKLHHLLQQRLVIPIPDLWMILLAAGIGKGSIIFIRKRSPQRSTILITLIGSSAIYALLSLQIYTGSIAILLPIVLPIATVWLFVLPSLKKQF